MTRQTDFFIQKADFKLRILILTLIKALKKSDKSKLTVALLVFWITPPPPKKILFYSGLLVTALYGKFGKMFFIWTLAMTKKLTQTKIRSMSYFTKIQQSKIYSVVVWCLSPLYIVRNVSSSIHPTLHLYKHIPLWFFTVLE